MMINARNRVGIRKLEFRQKRDGKKRMRSIM